MKFKTIVEYEYPTEHKPPVKAEIVLHGDRVVTDNIKRVEQVPCDAISRERVLGMAIFKQYNAKQVGNIGSLTQDEIIKDWDDMIDFIETLPPVQPKEKTGHWIIVDDCEKFIAKCSVCGRVEDSRMVHKYPYCHCGAKMVEREV